MNLLVVGVTHRTAPVPVLEALAAGSADLTALLSDLLRGEYVGEALVLSTCNRVEVYAGVSSFHGGLTEIGAVLAERAGRTPAELAPYLSVSFGADAVRHTFEVASGLDSMVVGEAQILGQLRDAYAVAGEQDSAGRMLHELMQQALRVGKRAHTETGIDRAGQSIVSAALALAGDLTGGSALVVGAGAMGALVLATLRRAGVTDLYVTNRGAARAQRLAESYEATVVPFGALDSAIRGVNLVVSATASVGYVIGPELVTRPVTLIDLAMPRDIDPAVAELPGVTLVDIDRLGVALHGHADLTADRVAVEEIVADEAEKFVTFLRGADVAPTVAALRTRADDLVEGELRRLGQRRPDLTDSQRAEVAQTVHRVVQRLLHTPTVRARELAAGPGGDRYTALVRELFDLEVPAAEYAADVPEVLS